jgi:hypothetical protein
MMEKRRAPKFQNERAHKKERVGVGGGRAVLQNQKISRMSAGGESDSTIDSDQQKRSERVGGEEK